MSRLATCASTTLGLTALVVLAGCAVNRETIDAVARSETAVRQAQQAVGSSQNGAIELQSARASLDQAKRAVDEGHEEQAIWLAHEASLNAELAQARNRSAMARKIADDAQASVQSLRQEVEHTR